MSGNAPRIWAVHDGKQGMASQVLGLAEATGFPFLEKRLDVRAPWRYLAPGLWPRPMAALGAGAFTQPPPNEQPAQAKAAGAPGPESFAVAAGDP